MLEKSLLKSPGDICDWWLQLKSRAGYEEMSDPAFIHYLLRKEEARQAGSGGGDGGISRAEDIEIDISSRVHTPASGLFAVISVYKVLTYNLYFNLTGIVLKGEDSFLLRVTLECQQNDFNL